MPSSKSRAPANQSEPNSLRAFTPPSLRRSALLLVLAAAVLALALSAGGGFAPSAIHEPRPAVANAPVADVPSVPGVAVTVTFDTEPVSCGSITFNGVTYTTGQRASVPSGTYQATANPCVDLGFWQWANGGNSGISITSASSPTTSVTVSANGILYGTFQSPQHDSVTLLTGPMNCGASAIIAGQVLTDGASLSSISPGTYNVSANLCTGTGWSFAGWSPSTPTGSATYGSSSSASTTMTFTGAPTITANFVNTAPNVVTLQPGPIGCGAIDFSGNNYTYGQTVNVASGGSYSYHIAGNPCRDYGIGNGWGYSWGVGSSASLSVSSLSGNATTITESGSGVLSITFFSNTRESFDAATGPTACGTIYLDGYPFTNGNSLTGGISPGRYNLTAVPCGGFSFSSWNLGYGGGLWPANRASPATVLNLTGSQTLTANFTASPTYPITLLTGPNSCGWVELNGQTYASGSTTLLPAGTYDLNAIPCTNFQTGNGWGYMWGSGPGSGLSVASPSSASTTVTVSGQGVLQAIFGSDQQYSISISTGPTTCGTVYVAGYGFTDGQSMTGGLPAGTYNITAVPCGGYAFSLWSFSGGISVARASSSTTWMTITADGNLGAVFIAGTPSTVTFTTSPSACGSIIFDGGSFTTSQTVSVATGGTYTISANPCNPYQFSGWSATAGISISNTGSNATTVTVNANGGLTGNWVYVKPQYTVYFYTGPTSCGSITVNGTTTFTNGQSASFVPGTSYAITANPCGNTFSYWNVGGGASLGSGPGTNPNTFSVTSAGNLVATFASTTVYRVFFHIGPIGCGAISFNGASYTDGQSVQLSPGSYNVGASGCANFNFASWEYIAGAGISVSGTTATLSSYANLTALFTSVTTYSVHAVVSPTTCGSLSFANISMADGASNSFSPGAYHVGDLPCANFHFQGWNGTGGVSVASSRTNPATATVTGDGAIALTNVGTVTYPVMFDTAPTTCGAVAFDLTNYPNGTTLDLAAGQYEIGSDPCGNFSFSGWATQGGVTVSGGGYLGSIATIGGAATITAVYGTPQTYTLRVVTNPSSSCTVVVGGNALSNGGSVSLAIGSYNLSAPSCPGYMFQGWNTTADATVARPLSSSTSIALTSDATLYANYAGLFTETVTIATAPVTCGSVLLDGRTLTTGQSIGLTAGAVYSVQADPCANFGFSSWGAGSSGNLTLASWGNPTTLTATGNGVLGVNFASSTQETINFYTSPSTCGSIELGGVSYTNGQSASASQGSWTISSTPCGGYYFSYWSATGGLSVASPGSSSTTVAVSGTGSLWANFTAGSQYPVTFTESGLSPGTAWSVTVSGFTITSTGTTNFRNLGPGSYSYSISGVSQGPGVQFGPTPASGTFAIASSGFTQAVAFSSQVYLSVSASPSGTGTASPASGWYTYGTSVTLSETPATGYLAAGWWGNGTGNYTGPLSSTTLALDYPETEVALFSPTSINTYAVNFTESGLPAGATWSATLGGTSLASSTPWIVFQEPNGANIPWSVQSPLVPSSGTEEVASTASGTLTVSGSPVSQYVSYSTEYYLGVQAVPGGEGSVSVASGWQAAGTTVTLSASPAPGASFVGWAGQGSGNYTGTLNPASVTLIGPVNETAVFSTSGGTSRTYIVSFATSPASCGSIAFGGTTYTNGGQDPSVPAQAYAISATPCPGEAFSGWSASGGLTVSAPSSASTAVSVSGNGTLTANFVAGSSGGFSVQFTSNPSTCGSITFAGFSYASGSSNRSVPAASYSASASACPGYSFAGWYATGGLSLSSTTLSTTMVTVSGNGHLQANFTGPGGPGGSSVSFTTSPTGCGTITFGGRSYGSGGTNGTVPAGTYAISATPCPGYAFSGWSTSGGLSVASSSQSSTSVTVSGGGTLTASFSATSTPNNGLNTVLGVPAGTLVALLGILVALLAVLFLVALMRGRRRSPPPGSSRAEKREEPTLTELAPTAPAAPAAASSSAGTYPPPPSPAPAPSESPVPPPPPSPAVPAIRPPEPSSEPPPPPEVPIAASNVGSKKPLFCSECGARNDRGATACSACGAGLNG